MNDLIFEILIAATIGFIYIYLIFFKESKEIKVDGWGYIQVGIALLIFGMIIDITDEFPSLSKYIFIGKTVYQSFLEKVVGNLVGFIFLAIGIWKWIPKIIEHNEMTKQKLEDAIDEVKVLSGLIPICATCKNIRDDAGYWDQIETYIGKHSEARFTHGICPNCKNDLLKELHKKK